MKKQTIIIILILIVIFLIIAFAVMQNMKQGRDIASYNNEYEKYLNEQFLGTEVTTLINKAIDTNEKNSVEKNENGYYVENSTNSIKIYIKLQQDGEYVPMERIFQVGITEFVKNFNLEDFKCTKINYHQATKLVKEVYIEVI